MKTINGEQIPDQVLSRKIDELLPLFHKDGSKLLYEGKLCIPRKSISTVMQLAYDVKTSGHFGYLKTILRLKNYQWKHKSWDLKQYVESCMVCQQSKHYLGKNSANSTSL